MGTEQAWKFPYMTWYEGGSTKRFSLEMWYDDYDEAKDIKHKYKTGDIVKCYWNPKDTGEVSVTLRGGDWLREGRVLMGQIMVLIWLGCCILPCFAMCCFIVCGSICSASHPVNTHIAKPALERADSLH